MFFYGDNPVLSAIELIAKVACIVHVIRHGHSLLWILLILGFPVGGPLIYFIVEILPDLRRGRGPLAFNVALPVSPAREIARLTEELEFSNTVEKRAALARAYAAAGRFPEAVETIDACLRGAFRDDFLLMLELAEIHFQAGQYQEALGRLTELERLRYRDKRERRLLLAARCHDKLGHQAEARTCFEQALEIAVGEEARSAYAAHLARGGETEAAHRLCEEIVRNAKHGGGAYRRANREWIKDAKDLLAAK